MKKKHRNITIKNTEFAWSVKENVDGDGGNRLTIWYNNKRIYGDIIGGHIDITPKYISNILNQINIEK